jgi:hypothetical protein
MDRMPPVQRLPDLHRFPTNDNMEDDDGRTTSP